MGKSVKTSFKSSYSNYRSIMDELKKKEFVNSYLLMGENDYFIDKICDFLSKNILPESERDFCQMTYYGSDTNVQDIMGVLLSYPMIGEYNVVIIKDAQNLKNIDQLHYYFRQPLKSTILILAYKNGNLDKRTTLYKKIEESGVVFESIQPRSYEIGEWIVELTRNNGVGIDPKALALLVDFLGTDLSRIDSELTKLLTRLDPKTKSITPQHIEDNIGISKDFNNFELVKALDEEDIHKALMIVENFSQNPKNNPFVVTLTALFNHYQKLFTLGLLIWKCRKENVPLPSEVELMKILKLTSPYFVKEYMNSVTRYPSGRTFSIIKLLRDYDNKNKGIGNVSTDDYNLLKELVIKIIRKLQ